MSDTNQTEPELGIAVCRQRGVHLFGQEHTATGFLLDSAYIITAAHALQEGEKLEVKLKDGTSKGHAIVIGVHSQSDLALLSLAHPLPRQHSLFLQWYTR